MGRTSDPRFSQTTPPAREQRPERGSGERLASWARDYGPDLQRFLSKRRIMESDIKDVCQEVYLRLLRFDRVEVVQNPIAYLFRIAANVAHDFKLSQEKWTQLDARSLEEESADGGPDHALDTAARRRCLERALAGLPPLPRAVLALQSQADLTYDDIAQRLGVSRRVVKRAVVRGHALLRAALAKELE